MPGEAGHDLVQRLVRAGQAAAGLAPLALQLGIQAGLAAEVVRDQLHAEPGPGGDVADPGTAEPLRPELLGGGVQQPLPGSFGVATALGLAG